MRNNRLGTLATCTVVAAGALVLGSTLASSAPAKRPPAGPIEAWEYKFVEISALEPLGAQNSLEAIAKLRSDPAAHSRVEKDLHNQLNALGREGWEMIDTDRKGTYWFKRRTR